MITSDDRIRLDVAAVDWTVPGVPGAFDQLLAARSEDAAWTAYHHMLDTVGHNHSGTLYDTAGPAAAPLAATACRGISQWTRFGAIEVLIDCLSWADDSPADDELRYTAADGTSVPVRTALLDAVRGVQAELSALAEGTGQTAQSAAELLEILAEVSAGDSPGPPPPPSSSSAPSPPPERS